MLADALPFPGAPSLARAPLCGVPDLDSAGVLRAGALTVLDTLARRGDDLVYAWMADTAVAGRIALVADGGNFLDVYALAAAARRRAAQRFPDASRRELAAHEEMTLERVRVARGFTAHQLQSIVEDGLPGAEADEVGLLVAPGLLDMYLDDELSREESRALVGRALSTLRRLAARWRVPALVVNRALAPTSDHPLRVLLDESVDEQVIVKPAPREGAAFVLPRRGAMFLAPGPGRTRLEDYLPPDERATSVAPIPPRKPGAWRSNGNRMMGKFGEVHRRSDWAVREAREGVREGTMGVSGLAPTGGSGAAPPSPSDVGEAT